MQHFWQLYKNMVTLKLGGFRTINLHLSNFSFWLQMLSSVPTFEWAVWLCFSKSLDLRGFDSTRSQNEETMRILSKPRQRITQLSLHNSSTLTILCQLRGLAKLFYHIKLYPFSSFPKLNNSNFNAFPKLYPHIDCERIGEFKQKSKRLLMIGKE